MDRLAVPLVRSLEDCISTLRAQSATLESEYAITGRLVYRSKNQHRSAKFFHAFRCAVRETKRCFEFISSLCEQLVAYRSEFRSASAPEKVADVFEPRMILPQLTAGEAVHTAVMNAMRMVEKAEGVIIAATQQLNAQITASYHMPWCMTVMACLARLYTVLRADRTVLERVEQHLSALLRAQRMQAEAGSSADEAESEDELGEVVAAETVKVLDVDTLPPAVTVNISTATCTLSIESTPPASSVPVSPATTSFASVTATQLLPSTHSEPDAVGSSPPPATALTDDAVASWLTESFTFGDASEEAGEVRRKKMKKTKRRKKEKQESSEWLQSVFSSLPEDGSGKPKQKKHKKSQKHKHG